jgi:hypothetical protein
LAAAKFLLTCPSTPKGCSGPALLIGSLFAVLAVLSVKPGCLQATSACTSPFFAAAKFLLTWAQLTTFQKSVM